MGWVTSVSPSTLSPFLSFLPVSVLPQGVGREGGAHSHLSSSRFSPTLAPLPLEYLDYILALRSSSFLNVTPKGATPLQGERKKARKTRGEESMKEREKGQASSKNTSLPREQGRQSKGKVRLCLPFCHSQRKPTRLLSLSPVGVPELQVPHSQQALVLITLVQLESYASSKNEIKSTNGRGPA